MKQIEKTRANGDMAHRTLAYLQEGSFARYLIERDGLPTFMALYEGGSYTKVYGKSFGEVERDWS
jgi:hypothetical protein